MNSSGAPICGEIHLAISLIEPGPCVSNLGLGHNRVERLNVVQDGSNKE
jgi:hypothetical protein